ncbi:NAD(P)-dependent alcohol dehydrogenase [Luteimonas sp. MC1572]|uniref:NAD(P)-dependent alcohol dehydrogenase n=1 Tax=Luteimonas sp. MC1572 TaxID=2799325 RepID=UPI0018F0D52E|nr:NAD(P)-dependent alcohol dehydrogenase [Luteimonas sp. MC1572]MBJ6982225.1 NAD(P)-dependent alcohol dehydrogenase [Luteimonas sp. MC1572]QQO03503.1 NAD(P)-dependent alcohol dehydrogenase [Luteimonas sp. MC1572]
MHKTAAYAATSATSPLAPWTLERRAPRTGEVLIDIRYCGVCHSDLHTVRGDWGPMDYPLVPGHEIVGHVAAVGEGVSRYKVGDAVGVGCFVDSCRTCEHCQAGEEQYCAEGMVGTYAGRDRSTGEPTQGGYSTRITVHEDYVLRIPEGLPLDRAAPLLCAGITTWSPLKHFGLKAGDELAVVGLGGLGHMAVKLGVALGANVTVLSTSEGKRADAQALGAHAFEVVGKDPAAGKKLARRFHMILDTASAAHDYNLYLGMLKVDGTMVLLGMPEPTLVGAGSLVMARRRLAGSLIGGIRETQEMLDFCAANGVVSDIELIDIADINDAYERMLRSDVRYRFVIDAASFGAA